MKSILFLLGGLALGFAAGFLMVEDAATEAVLQDRRERDSQLSAKPLGQDRQDNQRSAPRSEELASSGSLVLGELDIAVPAEGSGMIRGVVKDEDGAPVADVRLILTHNKRYDTTLWGMERENMSLEAYVRECARREQYRRRASKETYSDDEGRFQFNGLGDVPYRLAAFKEATKVAGRTPRRALYKDLKPGAELVLLATPRCELELNVLQVDGSTADAFMFGAERRGAGGIQSTQKRWATAGSEVCITTTCSQPNARSFRAL